MSRLALIAIAASLVLPTAALAQSDLYSPIVLHLAPTPRAAVLGSSAGYREVESLFLNPALAGLTSGTLVSVARYDAASLLGVASSTSYGSLNLAVGALYMDGHADHVRLPFWSGSMTVGGPVPVESAVGMVAMSTTFKGTRVGAAVKYVDERAGNAQDAVPSLDLGVSGNMGRFITGLSVQNIGAGLRYGGWHPQLPLRVSVGAATYGFVAGPFDLGGAAGISVLPDGELHPSIGAEVGYVPLDGYLFQARIGWRKPELTGQQRLSFGGTAGLDRFALDYAYEDWVGGGAHRLALRVR